jgi:hypothetical protein
VVHYGAVPTITDVLFYGQDNEVFTFRKKMKRFLIYLTRVDSIVDDLPPPGVVSEYVEKRPVFPYYL